MKLLKPIENPTPGIRRRPKGCDLCPLSKLGTGFVPDEVPENPLVAFLLDYPSADDVLENRPWGGKAGKYFLWSLLPYGRTRQDVLLANTLRCKPRHVYDGRNNDYPTGSVRRGAEITCRQYDKVSLTKGTLTKERSLETFDPNLFVVTFHPREIRLTPPLHRLIRADIKKAFKFAAEGYRPCVLFGINATQLVAPWIESGFKNWRGHFWKGSWPFKEGYVAPKATGSSLRFKQI